MEIEGLLLGFWFCSIGMCVGSCELQFEIRKHNDTSFILHSQYCFSILSSQWLHKNSRFIYLFFTHPTIQCLLIEKLLTCSQFPYGRNHGTRRSLLALSCGAVKERWCGSSLFLLLSPVNLNSCFCPNTVLNLLCCNLHFLLVFCDILRPFVDIPAPHFLLPLREEFLSFYLVCLFISLAIHSTRCWQFLSCFAKGRDKAKVWDLSLSCRFGPTFHVLTRHLPKLRATAIGSTFREPAQGWGYVECSGVHGLIVRSCRGRMPSALGWTSRWSLWHSGIWFPLVPSMSLNAALSASSQFAVM